MGKWAGAVSPEFVDGAYRTVPRERPLFARAFPGLGFYTWFFYFVCKGANSARRGRYSDTDWSQNSLEVLRALENFGVQIEITGTDRFSRLDLLIRPPLRFLKGYILRGGFLDGTHGYIIARAQAWSAFLKYAKLWELQHRQKKQFNDLPDKNTGPGSV